MRNDKVNSSKSIIQLCLVGDKEFYDYFVLKYSNVETIK